MWFKHRAWRPTAWILSLVNVVAVWPAAQAGEALHATTHALLAVLLGLGAMHLERRMKPIADADLTERLRELEGRLEDLNQFPDEGSRIAELEERLDFTERALVEVRARAELKPKE